MTILLATASGDWSVVAPDLKLKLRARLPGASAFDDAAAGFREARRLGASASSQLAAAMAASWLVNSAVPSTTFQKWLAPDGRAQWDAAIALIEGGGKPWNERSRADREALEVALGAIVAAGGSIGAVSKVLSLLSLEPVPLMPDAAVSHVLRAVPRPAEADLQSAPVRVFLPMMDRLAEAELKNAEVLPVLAKAIGPSALRARDMLDRLLWFESVGYRHFRNERGGWYWLRGSSDGQEGVIFVAGKGPAGAASGTCIDLPGEDEFAARAQAALEEILPAAIE